MTTWIVIKITRDEVKIIWSQRHQIGEVEKDVTLKYEAAGVLKR